MEHSREEQGCEQPVEIDLAGSLGLVTGRSRVRPRSSDSLWFTCLSTAGPGAGSRSDDPTNALARRTACRVRCACARRRAARAAHARCEAAALPVTVHAPVFLAGPAIPAADVRADFDGWLAQMTATHPDLGLRTDRPAFERIRDEIAASFPHQVVVEGATEVPSLAPIEQRAAHEFVSKVLEGDVGYLKAAEFDPAFRDAFAAFTRRAFADLEARGIRALIIDVRDNGGGDDPLWQQGLMEHITRTPYTQAGWFTVRVTQRNADPGDVIGEIQRHENKKRIAPSAVDPLRFAGPVYILAGPFSYSSTIQFLVAAQDFGIARIAGRETGGLSCQTGQVTVLEMPHTGLRAYTPIAAFTRPSGTGCERGVIPDLAIDDDGLDQDLAPALLARKIAATLDRGALAPRVP
jgi:hypothetical protein